MKNIFMLLMAAVLMNGGSVFGQTDTTINGVPYTLFSPGLWVEVEPYPTGYVHCGDPTEVVEVTSATGKIWMDRNLGSSQVATSSTDADSYGDLYQWGRFADGHQCRDSETINTQATTAEPFQNNAWDGKFIRGSFKWLDVDNVDLWQSVNRVNNPCPEGYRVPTETELNAERLSWGSNNAAGAFASPLKLPMGGERTSSHGSLINVGTIGRYWSNTVSSTASNNSSQYLFLGLSAGIGINHRATGFSVRCLKE